MAAADASVLTTSARADAEPPPAVAASDLPFERGHRWSGHYFCAQGRTELTLVVEAVDGEEVEVLFEFSFPGSSTHDPADGSYRMRGVFDRRKQSLRLKGERWIDQPDGYAMVDLVGTLSRSGALHGTVSGPGCSTFSLSAERPRARSRP